MSDDGGVVVGSAVTSPGIPSSARWSRVGGVEALNGVGGDLAWQARAANADGSVAVGSTGGLAVRWQSDAGTGIVPAFAGGTFGVARAVSADGAVVVGSCMVSNGMNHAFRWTAQTGMVDLGVRVGANISRATGVSAAGDVLVGYDGGDGITRTGQAFRWTMDGGMQGLSAEGPWVASRANAVSRDGRYAVGRVYTERFGANRAVRWDATGAMEVLDSGDGEWSSDALMASADGGTVLLDRTGYLIFEHVFLWRASDGIVNVREHLATLGLDMYGWQLSSAVALSADGQSIVGNGVYEGLPASWLLTIPSVPTCLMDYNTDGVVDPDDIGDYITDFFAPDQPAGPGGYSKPCPGNSPPYDRGYRADFMPNNAGGCDPPNPDSLGDWLTGYFAGRCGR